MYPAPVVAFIVILVLLFDYLLTLFSARFSRRTRFVVYLRDLDDPDKYDYYFFTLFSSAKHFALSFPNQFIRIEVLSPVASIRKLKVPKSTK